MPQFSDDFDRPDDTPLGSGGDGWLIQTGSFEMEANRCVTNSNFATCAAMIDSGVTAFAEDHYAEGSIGALSADGFRGPAVRCSGTGSSSVLYDFISYGGTSGRIYRLDPGGGATLIAQGYTVADGDILGLLAETNDESNVVLTPSINGVPLTPVTDSSPGRLFGGQPGQYGYRNNSSGTRTWLNNFFATDELGLGFDVSLSTSEEDDTSGLTIAQVFVVGFEAIEQDDASAFGLTQAFSFSWAATEQDDGAEFTLASIWPWAINLASEEESDSASFAITQTIGLLWSATEQDDAAAFVLSVPIDQDYAAEAAAALHKSIIGKQVQSVDVDGHRAQYATPNRATLRRYLKKFKTRPKPIQFRG